jgi:hypothetical protein
LLLLGSVLGSAQGVPPVATPATVPAAATSYQPALPVNATLFYPGSVPTASRYHGTRPVDSRDVEAAREWASRSAHGAYVDQMHSILGSAVTPPAAPSVLNASTNGRDVALSWNASAGATSDQIFRKRLPGRNSHRDRGHLGRRLQPGHPVDELRTAAAAVGISLGSIAGQRHHSRQADVRCPALRGPVGSRLRLESRPPGGTATAIARACLALAAVSLRLDCHRHGVGRGSIAIMVLVKRRSIDLCRVAGCLCCAG